MYKIEDSRLNLTKGWKYLHNENFKTLKNESKEGTVVVIQANLVPPLTPLHMAHVPTLAL